MISAKYKTVEAVYPSPWLKAHDLRGKAVTVTIERVDVQEFRQRDGSHKAAIVLAFERASKQMICNKTQAHAVADVLGTDLLAEWTGHMVTLTAGQAPNGRPTVQVLAPSHT